MSYGYGCMYIFWSNNMRRSTTFTLYKRIRPCTLALLHVLLFHYFRVSVPADLSTVRACQLPVCICKYLFGYHTWYGGHYGRVMPECVARRPQPDGYARGTQLYLACVKVDPRTMSEPAIKSSQTYHDNMMYL